MFYLVYNPSTKQIYGFFHNTSLANTRIQYLKKLYPDINPEVVPFSMNNYMEMSL